ncbi:MAG TPA: secondary thiamine-phosphate synthase enzyme YjbQ [Steroidobacteraceae bacterium]
MLLLPVRQFTGEFEEHNMKRQEWSIRTAGRGFTDLTTRVGSFVRESGVRDGMCNVFLVHTSASLILGENADPSVRRDLETFFARLAPDGDPIYEHDAEGADDMPSHIRTVLTQNSVSIPIVAAELALGTWQAIYLWEHRKIPHERRVIVTAW